MNIGRRVREVREDLGMQRTVLARRVGVAENTIYRIETGTRTPSVELLEKLARALRTDPAELLREEPVPLGKAPRGEGRLEVEIPIPRDSQEWERLVASVRERQDAVEATVEELIKAPRDEANPRRVKWALEEAQDCATAIALAMPGSRREQGKIVVEITPSSPDLAPFKEYQAAWRFYEGIRDRLADAGLVVLEERAGLPPEPVVVGI
jgi:transcriptional regulator with XRE-family HTH domain